MTESNFVATSTDLDDIMAPRGWFRSAGSAIFSSGEGTFGQLGNNSSITRVSSPVQEISKSGSWKHFSAGERVAGAIKNNGTLWTWGRNDNGELGNDSRTCKSSPIQEISSSTNWHFLSINTLSSAIKTDGTLWSWGLGSSGGIGNNCAINKSSPSREITSSTNWRFVNTNTTGSALAIKTDGTLWGWGENNLGQLGIGSATDICSPVREALSASNWCTLNIANFSAIAVKTDGTLWAWGFNSFGALGDGTTVNKSIPTQEVTSSTDWISAKTQADASQAIKCDKSLWLWGQTNLLSPQITVSCSPIQEPLSTYDWYKHSPGLSSSAAVKTDGTLWVWGTNGYSMLGTNNCCFYSVPTQVNAVTTHKDVCVGSPYQMHTIRLSDTLC